MGEFTNAQAIRDIAYGVTIPEGDRVDTQLGALISKAEVRMLQGVPSVRTRVDSGALSSEFVGGVVQDMVLRVLKNPHAARQLGLDDFQVTLDNVVSTGELHLSDRERELLSPPRRPRFRSARLQAPAWGPR